MVSDIRNSEFMSVHPICLNLDKATLEFFERVETAVKNRQCQIALERLSELIKIRSVCPAHNGQQLKMVRIVSAYGEIQKSKKRACRMTATEQVYEDISTHIEGKGWVGKSLNQPHHTPLRLCYY